MKTELDPNFPNRTRTQRAEIFCSPNLMPNVTPPKLHRDDLGEQTKKPRNRNYESVAGGPTREWLGVARFGAAWGRHAGVEIVREARDLGARGCRVGSEPCVRREMFPGCRAWGCRIPVSRNFGASGGLRFLPLGVFFELKYAFFQEYGLVNEFIHFPLWRLLVPPIFKVRG
jgi:hypothetical protein